MAYIPKEHIEFDILPRCRKNGYEVFSYPVEMQRALDKLCKSENLMPYGYHSYEEYDCFLDSLIAKYNGSTKISAKLKEYKETIHIMNQKEEWSVLKYLGESDDGLGLTHGRYYYWPTSRGCPDFDGVIDDEEFTSYLYDTSPALWEIILDPTGMAERAMKGIYTSDT